MSTSGLTNQYIPPTLDGLTVVDADQIYIDGQLVDLTTLVPYTGADKPVDVGAQPIRTTYAPVATNDVVNLQALTDAVTYVDTSVALTYLSKISTVTQSVAGPVSFTNGVQTSTNKDVSLASTVIITPNYPNPTVYDGGVTAGSLFGTITNSAGVYQSTSGGDGGILVLGSGLSSGRVRLMINLLVNDTNGVAVSLFGSSDGVNPYQSIASHTFPPNTTTFWSSDTTFTLSYPYLILICNTASPGLGATVQWYGLTLYQMGVAQTNVTMPSQTADRVVVLDASKRLVASGVTTTSLSYIDNLSSDAQSQINSKASITYVDTGLAGKLNLSGSNANQNINLGSFKVQSNATPTASTDYITKAYGDSTYALTSALSGYVPYTGATADLNMGSRFVLCNSDPSNNNELTRKSYVDTLIAGRVPRTGDTSLVGDYATSGNITGAGLISTGGIRGSFYTTASAGIPYSNTSDKGKWFKIVNVGTVDMKFYLEGHITYSVGGYHGHVHFIASVMYNSRPCIRIVHSSFYGSPIVERLRLSTDDASIYNQGFIEMYLGNNTWNDTTIYVYGVNSAPINTSYSIVSTKTAGTSTGFTYQTVYPETMMDIHMSGTRFYIDAGSNMGNSGEIRPGTSVVWGNMGDCRIYNGTADAYNPTSTANNLIIKSWWGIGYESYDGGVRIAMDTRTGDGYYGGRLNTNTWRTNSSQIITSTPQSTQMAGYSGVTVGGADNSSGYWMGLDSGGNTWCLSLAPSVAWKSFRSRAYDYEWYPIGGGSFQISNNGRVGIGGMSDGKLNIWNPSAGPIGGSVTHFGFTDNNNYIRGNTTYIDTVLNCATSIQRQIFPATTQAVWNRTTYPLTMLETDGYIRHGACSTWRYENNSIAWTGGFTIPYLYYKPTDTCSVIINISGSWYATGGGFSAMQVMIYQQGASLNRINKGIRKYFNTTYNHETISFPIVIPSSELSGIDWFSVYIYGSGPITSDSGDFLWMNVMVIG